MAHSWVARINLMRLNLNVECRYRQYREAKQALLGNLPGVRFHYGSWFAVALILNV